MSGEGGKKGGSLGLVRMLWYVFPCSLTIALGLYSMRNALCYVCTYNYYIHRLPYIAIDHNYAIIICCAWPV